MTIMPEYSDLSYTLAGVKRSNPFDRRRRFAEQMMQTGVDSSPVLHPLQGAARLAQALVGGWMGSKADADEEVAAKKQQEAFATAMSETDPQKRISMIAAVDPPLGARLSGQLAIEQHKLGQQREGLQTAAGNFGASYGAPPQGGQLAVPQGTAPGNPGGFANNVGNIRATNINWEGKGAPHNGFETFATPQAGANAMAQNLRAYVQKNPGMTIAQAISTWAPPNENNTQAYIKGLSEATGVNPGMPLAEVLNDPVMAAQLMDGIARIEKGGLPQGFTADTFINAGGGNAQQPGAPLTINMTPGGPNNAPQPQIPQGDNVGMPPAPSPQAVSGPVLQAPQVPEVPRPMPTQQQLAQYQQRLASGEFGSDPRTAPAAARAALEAELDRQHGILRDEAKMRFAQQDREYGEQRKVQREQENPKFTEDQNKAHAYALRISKALPLLEGMTNDPQGMPGVIDRGVVNLPVVGNMFSGPRGQGWDQASRDLINAILRRESGATITDAEFANAYRQYIPQPGDRPETIQQKMANVRTQLKAFADTAGRMPDVYSMGGQKGATVATEPVPLPANSVPTPGYVEQGYRFKGGNPADQRNWERVQ